MIDYVGGNGRQLQSIQDGNDKINKIYDGGGDFQDSIDGGKKITKEQEVYSQLSESDSFSPHSLCRQSLYVHVHINIIYKGNDFVPNVIYKSILFSFIQVNESTKKRNLIFFVIVLLSLSTTKNPYFLVLDSVSCIQTALGREILTVNKQQYPQKRSDYVQETQKWKTVCNPYRQDRHSLCHRSKTAEKEDTTAPFYLFYYMIGLLCLLESNHYTNAMNRSFVIQPLLTFDTLFVAFHIDEYDDCSILLNCTFNNNQQILNYQTVRSSVLPLFR